MVEAGASGGGAAHRRDEPEAPTSVPEHVVFQSPKGLFAGGGGSDRGLPGALVPTSVAVRGLSARRRWRAFDASVGTFGARHHHTRANGGP